MADPAVAILADCLSAARARVDRAEMDHAAAIGAVATAKAARDAAQAALFVAETAWHRQMAEGFDPMLGGLLAQDVRARAAALADADTAQAQAEREAARTAESWQGEEARRRAVEALATTARRRARRRADERLLATLADRETFRRSVR